MQVSAPHAALPRLTTDVECRFVRCARCVTALCVQLSCCVLILEAQPLNSGGGIQQLWMMKLLLAPV
jgi:hypothetical protein